MSKQALFNFESEHILVDMKARAKAKKHVASISLHPGLLRLSPAYVKDNGFDGAYVKLYADVSKKAIGWKFLKEHNLSDLKGYHKLECRTYKNNKGYESVQCTISIGKLLRTLTLSEKTYCSLPIQKYSGSMFEEDIHYVELKK